MTTWHTTPRDQGQIVHVEWTAVGEDGAICRVTDRSIPGDTPCYTLHRWRVSGEFEPWNGRLGVVKRGRKLTEAEARRILEAQ
jgi:hypothetical protein